MNARLIVNQVLLLSSALLASPPAHAAGPRILVTTFAPYGLKSTNRSQSVALELARLLPSGMELTICPLPIDYVRAPQVALACLARMHPAPDYVLSLGESDADCRPLQIGRLAFNRDYSALRDAAGRQREDQAIDEDGPKVRDLTFPYNRLLKALGSSAAAVAREAEDLGYFVCNHTAYVLADTIGAERRIPYGFIHVPTDMCQGPASQPAAVAQSLATALGGLARRR